ncbi:MAG TPA: FHA domain-containing protein [Kofleriaceae bacterium]|nr:FHA domain-containing protein [Kofleriaceae bacterium]
MLRFEVREDGHTPLPPIDAPDDAVIGSGASATIRLPAAIAEAAHVRIENGAWKAFAETIVDGVPHGAGQIGPIAETVEFGIGRYRVRVQKSPAGAVAATPQRTESLARELVRAMLGDSGAPELEIERGPRVGSKRRLAPPESSLIVGRGDEAAWVILDEDLSRAHAEIRRGWDGVRIVDLDSKNGTRVDGAAVGGEGMPLRDGALVELGPVVLRFRDPAEKHLHGGAIPARTVVRARRSAPRAPIVIAAVVAVLAVAGIVWVLAG